MEPKRKVPPLKVFMIPDKSEPNPIDYALTLLNAGKQDFDAFALVAGHFKEAAGVPATLSPEALNWITTALIKIRAGEEPKKALGIMRPVGRRRPSGVLESKVSAFVELHMRRGASKTLAIDLAAQEYHKDRRHIQRLLVGKIQIDMSAMPEQLLVAIADCGLDIALLPKLDTEVT